MHGDYRLDNTILDPTTPADRRPSSTGRWPPSATRWPTSACTSPTATPRSTRCWAKAAATSPRQPTAGALAAHYAAVTGRDVGGLSFYLGLGYFKAAIIAAGIHARHVHGQTVGAGFEGAGTAVAPLAAAGLAALRTEDIARPG